MLAVSDRFLAALRDSHAVSIACYLYPPGSSAGTEVAVNGGIVDMNADSRILRQGSVDIAFSAEDPTTATLIQDLPFGGHVTLERGIAYPDGEVERVPLGWFRVESVVWSALQGQATLTLADRFAQVQDEPFTAPWSPVGLRPSNAVVALVQQVFGSAIAYHVLTNPASEPLMTAGTVYDQDRTQAISDLCQAVGAQCFFDALGDFVIRPAVRSGPSVWTIDAGDRGVLTGATETLDRSSVRNGVSLRGQPDADQPPLYALAVYSNPTSPLRWGGPFGRVALIAESTAVTTQAQANAAAQSLLGLRLSLSRNLELAAVPNPALEPGDPVTVIFPDGRSEAHSLNEVHIGLGPDAALGLITNTSPAAYAPTIDVLMGSQAVAELAEAQLVAA